MSKPRSKPKPRDASTWRPRPQHIRAAKLRAAGLSWAKVAQELGFAVHTVTKYTLLPGFEALVRQQIDDDARGIVAKLIISTVKQLAFLGGMEVADDGSVTRGDPADHKAAVKACTAILAHADRCGLFDQADANAVQETLGAVDMSDAVADCDDDEGDGPAQPT